jgi:hypothetical protein
MSVHNPKSKDVSSIVAADEILNEKSAVDLFRLYKAALRNE